MHASIPIIIAYFVGAIPTGLIVTRLKGVDLRTVGSGNIGATNVGRALGKRWAVATFIGDAMKGFVPVFALPKLCHPHSVTMATLAVLCGIAAISGHVWPVYLKFKGGKGVATSAGVLLAIAPLAAFIGVIVWYILFQAKRYVSLASIGAAIAIPMAGWPLYAKQGFVVPIALTALTLLIIAKHRTNIQRLMNGTESRFERKSKAEQELR